MSMQSILDTIRKGVEFAEGLAPALAAIPGIGPALATAVKATGAVEDVITNLQTLIAERKIVATSTDEQELRGYVERLAAANDALNQQVLDS